MSGGAIIISTTAFALWVISRDSEKRRKKRRKKRLDRWLKSLKR